MSQNKIIFLDGILVIILPFLGFPSLWKTIIFLGIGLSLVVLAVVAHTKRLSGNSLRGEIVTDVYVETNGRERV